MKACILSVSGPVLTADETTFLADAKPWGVIVMGRSCVSKVQLKALVQDIWGAVDRKCLIFIDQEGGRVARLKAPEWPIFPAGEAYVRMFHKDEALGREATWLGHRLIAAELHQLGIYADCSPVVDVRQPDAHDIIGDRAFGMDSVTVGTLAGEALRGLHDGGVAGVIKHIPGHGRAMVDSHEALPIVDTSPDHLEIDFAAFRAVSHAPMAMTAHLKFTAFDTENPVTHSETIIQDVIRRRIGFDGLLMTDDLGMEALGGSLADRGKLALAAGCDVLLHCAGFKKDPADILSEMIEVADASPELNGKALARAKAADDSVIEPLQFDVKEGWQRFYDFFPELREAAV